MKVKLTLAVAFITIALVSCTSRSSKDYDDNRNAGENKGTSGSTSGSHLSGTTGNTRSMDTAVTTSGHNNPSRSTPSTVNGYGRDGTHK